MKFTEYLENEQRIKLYSFETPDGVLWCHFNGQTQKYDLNIQTSSKKTGLSSLIASPQVKSPMPGKITKVCVKTEQSVKKGDVLIVIEAMKMEYTLKASMDGRVKFIHCQLGEQVAHHQLLVELEEIDGTKKN